MPRPSREREIERAALRCFARLGYDGTRVKHIAAQAGVSEAALYKHWRSKEALAAKLFADGMRSYSERVGALARAPGRSVAERIRLIAAASIELYRTEPDAWTFLIQGQARFLPELDATFPYPLHVLELLIGEGQRDGTVRAGDVRILAGVATGCFTYPVIVAIYARAGSSDPTATDAAELIAAATWDSLRA
jgi:AcrR family transcriptional regulator